MAPASDENYDYITMIDLLGDIADDDEGADGDKAADKLQPEDA